MQARETRIIEDTYSICRCGFARFKCPVLGQERGFERGGALLCHVVAVSWSSILCPVTSPGAKVEGVQLTDQLRVNASVPNSFWLLGINYTWR